MGISSVGSSGSSMATQSVESCEVVEQPKTQVVDTTSASSFQGPTGTVKQGDATYDVKDGQVSFNGKNIGTVSDDGHYQVTLGGHTVEGNVGELLGASVVGTLSTGAHVDNRVTGDVEVGNARFVVNQGDVFQNGTKVGTVNDKGDFDLMLNGHHEQGNVTKVSGAVYNAITHDGNHLTNQVSGSVTVGGQSFSVKAGEVLHDGKVIGTINDHGDYNVTLQGKQQIGSLSQLANVSISIDGRNYAGARSDPAWLTPEIKGAIQGAKDATLRLQAIKDSGRLPTKEEFESAAAAFQQYGKAYALIPAEARDAASAKADEEAGRVQSALNGARGKELDPLTHVRNQTFMTGLAEAAVGASWATPEMVKAITDNQASLTLLASAKASGRELTPSEFASIGATSAAYGKIFSSIPQTVVDAATKAADANLKQLEGVVYSKYDKQVDPLNTARNLLFFSYLSEG